MNRWGWLVLWVSLMGCAARVAEERPGRLGLKAESWCVLSGPHSETRIRVRVVDAAGVPIENADVTALPAVVTEDGGIENVDMGMGGFTAADGMITLGRGVMPSATDVSLFVYALGFEETEALAPAGQPCIEVSLRRKGAMSDQRR